jgi:hypothetical protein
MANMRQMFEAVAIWAKNLKVASCVIISIAIFMVNAENVGVFFVAASFAYSYFACFFHIQPNRRERRGAIFNFLLIAALDRAIFFTRPLGCRI